MKKFAVTMVLILIVLLSIMIYFHSSSGKTKIAGFIERHARENYRIHLQIHKLNFSLFPLKIDLTSPRIYGGKQDKELFFAAKRVQLKLLYSTFWKHRLIADEIRVADLQLDTKNLPHPKLPEDWTQKVQAKKLVFTGGLLKYSQISLTDLKVHASAQPDRLNITELSGSIESLRLKASGVIAKWNAPVYRFHYSVEGLLPEKTTEKITSPISGAIVTSGNITGTEGHYVVTGQFFSNSLSVFDCRPFVAKATYRYDAKSKAPLAISAKWESLYLSGFRRVLPPPAQLASVSNGSFAYEGTQDIWSGSGKFGAAFAATQEKGIPFSGSLSGFLSQHAIHLERSELRFNNSSVSTTGILDPVKLDLHVRAFLAKVSDIPLALPELRKVPGSYHFDGTVQGPYRSWQVSGFLAGDTKIFGPVRAELQANRQNLQGKASLPELSANAHGSYAFLQDRFQLTVNFLDAPLQKFRRFLPDLPKQVSGNMTAHFAASGGLRSLKNSNAALVINQGTLSNGGITAHLRPESSVKLASKKIHLDLAARIEEGFINVAGNIPIQESQPLDLQITANSDLKLASVFTDRISAGGSVQANIEIHGTRSTPVYAGEIEAPDFFLNYPAAGIRLTKGAALLHFDQKLLVARTHGMLNDAPMELNAQIPVTEKPGEIHFRVTSFPISGFGNALSGKIDAKLDATGTGTKLTGWNGHAEITSTAFSIANNNVRVSPVRAVLSQGILRIDNIRGYTPDVLDINAGGMVNLNDGTLKAKIKSSVELAAAGPFFHKAQVSGLLVSDISLQGLIQAPEYYGKIFAERLSVQSSDFMLPVSDIHFKASLQKNKLQIETLKGKLGGGPLTASGALHLDAWKIGKLDMSLNGKSIAIAYPKGTQIELDTVLRLTGDRTRPVVSGEVLVRRAILSTDVDNTFRAVRTALAEKQEIVGDPDQRGKIGLDVQIKNDQPVVISNNLGNLLADLDLKIKGISSRPRLQGEVKVVEGSQLYLQTRTFKVDRGIIRFEGAEKARPILDLALTSVVQDEETKRSYKIRLPIRGPIDDLIDEDPQSIPYLPPQQVYFLLLTGRAEAQLMRAESQFMRQQLLSYYSAMEVLPVPEKIARGVILNRAQIGPEMISSEKDPGGELVTGKDFFSGVSLVYAHPLEKSSEQIWIADYKLRKDIAIRFVDQEDGTISSNVRHMLRFGKGSVLASSVSAEKSKPTKTIGRVNIQNGSNMPDEELRKIVNLQPGDPYGEITIKQRIAEIKQALQGFSHLYPSVHVNRTDDLGRIDLQFVISGNGQRSLKFHGYQPDEGRLQQYNGWWREGFSETSVLGLIEQDLFRELWKAGYHRARVQQKRHSNGKTIAYQFEVTPGTHFLESKLHFIGMNHLRDLESELNKLYSSREEMLSEAIHEFASFQQKIEAVSVTKGFLHLQVKKHQNEFDLPKGRVDIRIWLDEGTPSRIAEVRVSDGQHFPQDLQQQLKLKAGSIYDSSELVEDQLNIGRYYEARGYYKFRIKSRVFQESDDSKLILFHDMETGQIARISSIQISGNRLTDQTLIKKQLKFHENDVLSLSRLADAQKNLNDLGVFQDVKIQAQETTTPDHYAVSIQVQETKNYEFSYAAGYNSEKKLEGIVQLSDVNLFGTGQTMSFTAKLNSEDRLYRLMYHSPSLSGIRWKTLVVASFEELEQPLLFTETAAIEFQRQGRLSRHFFVIGDYRFERVRVTEKDPTDAFYIGEEPVNISSLSGTLLTDTRNDPIAPTGGKFISTQFSYAPRFLGSQAPFVRNYSQVFNYHSFGKKVLVSAVRFGMANPGGDDLIATERFFAGGSFSVRGFEKDQLGPRDPMFRRPEGGEAVLIINQELRFPIPIHEWLHGVVFYDAGNVYATIGDFDPLKLRHSLGFGVRLNTPVGIGRFDVGFNLRTREDEKRTVFHFALGHAF